MVASYATQRKSRRVSVTAFDSNPSRHRGYSKSPAPKGWKLCNLSGGNRLSTRPLKTTVLYAPCRDLLNVNND